MPMRRRGMLSVPRLRTTERMPLWVPGLPRSLNRSVPKGRSISSYTTRQRVVSSFRNSTRSLTAVPLRFMKVCGLARTSVIAAVG